MYCELHFAWCIAEAKCILAMAVCVSVFDCVSVCLYVPRCIPTLLHGPGCNWGNGRGCAVVVHYWADLQSVRMFCCCDIIHVCRLIDLYTANVHSAEREMSASACTHSMSGYSSIWMVQRVGFLLTGFYSTLHFVIVYNVKWRWVNCLYLLTFVAVVNGNVNQNPITQKIYAFILQYSSVMSCTL